MNSPVVLLGETLVSLAGAPDRPLDRGAQLDLTFGGAELNVAIGLARLGHHARWVSIVGEDVFGNVVVRGLRGEGVDVSAVQTSHLGPTAMMVKNRRPGGEPEVFYYRKGSAMSHATVGSFDPENWRDAKVLYLTGITPALSSSCRELVEHISADAAHRGIPIWLDPNHRRKLWDDDEARRVLLSLMPKIEVVLAGISEGVMLTGSADPMTIGRRLLDEGARRVIVKAGEEGALLFDGENEVHEPIFSLHSMVDPVGAGDGFAAGALSAHLEGLSWPEALRRGNAIGAIVCQTRGDWEGLPTRRELDDFVAQRRDTVR